MSIKLPTNTLRIQLPLPIRVKKSHCQPRIGWQISKTPFWKSITTGSLQFKKRLTNRRPRILYHTLILCGWNPKHLQWNCLLHTYKTVGLRLGGRFQNVFKIHIHWGSRGLSFPHQHSQGLECGSVLWIAKKNAVPVRVCDECPFLGWFAI